MTTVWKYVWPNGNVFNAAMPRGAEILFVRERSEKICLWARIDPAAPTEIRRFLLVGTGNDAPSADQGRYVGSVMLQDGMYVFHLFEVKA